MVVNPKSFNTGLRYTTFDDFIFVEKWQGKVTVIIEGVTYQFQNGAAWESYKTFRSGYLPSDHREALAWIDADEVKVITHAG